tara:strand:+ start:7407 stop:8969 length:1563 start_codon:yes stop_codon:yes gene_type:complete
MAVTNITYTDKEQGQVNAQPITKKLTFGDVNEVKTVVNNNATELTTAQTRLNTGDVTIDSSAFTVLTATTSQALWAENDEALLNARSTGVRFGGDVTINAANNTRFDVAAGAGQILNNTNPETPSFKGINFNAIIGISVLNISAPRTFIYIDINGVVQQQTTIPTRAEFRTKMFLGRLTSNGINIIAVALDVTPIQQDVNQIRDLSEFIGSIKKGLQIAPNANLTFERTSGEFFDFGTNFFTDPLDPHVRAIAAVNPAIFLLYKRDGFISQFNTNVPVTQFDNAGTLTTLTNGRFVNHRVFGFQNGDVVIQYGQQEFLKLSDAVEAIGVEPFVQATQLQTGILLGIITVQKDTTSLTNVATTRITLTNQFGGIGGGAAASISGTFLEVGNNLNDVASVTTARINLLGSLLNVATDRVLEQAVASNLIEASVATTYSINLAASRMWLLVMTGNTTFTISALANSTSVASTVKLTGAFVPTLTGVNVYGDTYDGSVQNLLTFNSYRTVLGVQVNDLIITNLA